jgi:hypothetical protein
LGEQKQSNARLVKWSDGSVHLMVGKEAFELTEHNIAKQQFYIFSRHQALMRAQASRVVSKTTTLPAVFWCLSTSFTHMLCFVHANK